MNDKLQFWQDLKSGRFASMVRESARGQRLSNSRQAYNVIKPMLAEDEDVEKVYVVFLDAQNKILAIEKMFSGSITAATIYTREIVKRLIGLKATAFLMAHNHPSSGINPSAEDKAMTIKVGIAAASIDVNFHDHIIIGDGYFSMADNGWMKEITNKFQNLFRAQPMAMEAGQAIVKNENDLWKHNDLAWELHWWFDFFNIAFFKAQPVSVPVFSLKTRESKSVYYLLGKETIGIRDNYNLNRFHFNRPLWENLLMLLHQMTHSWQAMHGKPSKSWFHNKEFRSKMMQFGIICNTKGCHLGLVDPFVFLLNKHGIVFDRSIMQRSDKITKLPKKVKLRGKSKLKKWSCGCTNIRVAVGNFKAKCLSCGNSFELTA